MLNNSYERMDWMNDNNRKYIVSFLNFAKFKISPNECVDTLLDLRRLSEDKNLQSIYGNPSEYVEGLKVSVTTTSKSNILLLVFFILHQLFLVILFLSGRLSYTKEFAVMFFVTGAYLFFSRDYYLFGILNFEKRDYLYLCIIQILVLVLFSGFGLFSNIYIHYLVSEYGNLHGMLGKMTVVVGGLCVFVAGIILLTGLYYYNNARPWFFAIVIQSIAFITSLVYWLIEWQKVDTPQILPNYHLGPWGLSFVMSCVWYTMFNKKSE